jgi:putative DNA primase/helicase
MTKPLEYAKRVQANVPDELKRLPVWLCWRWVVDGKDKKKVPYYHTGKPRAGGKSLDTPNDRAQLVTFDEALAAFMKARRPYTGLGVALGLEPASNILLSGIDLDDIAPDDPRVRQIIKAAHSYAEISPSGTGLKIFGLNDIGEEKHTELHLEIYSRARYFTVTGQAL